MLCPMNRTLAEYLNEELNRRGWSRRTLAMYAEISPDTVATAVKGNRTPEPETIRKIAKALQVDEAYLLRMAGHLEERPKNLKDDRLIDLALRVEALPIPLKNAVIASLAAQVDAMGDLINALYEEFRLREPAVLAEAEAEERQAQEQDGASSPQSQASGPQESGAVVA